VFGKREIGQFTIYDLVLVLLVANAVQPAMTGPDSSLLGGVIIIVTLVLINRVVARLDTIPLFHRFFTPHPAVVIQGGKYLDAVMSREGVDREDVEMAIREHGIDAVSEVQLGVLEADGSISIVPKDAEMARTQHRVRRRYRARD
jgi:uncharacterized membrane protein YcaP (DUF421 family)